MLTANFPICMQFDVKTTIIMDEECVHDQIRWLHKLYKLHKAGKNRANLHLDAYFKYYLHCSVLFHVRSALRKCTLVNGSQRIVNLEHSPVNRRSFVRSIPQHKHHFIASIISAHITRKINGFANKCFHCNDGNYNNAKKMFVSIRKHSKNRNLDENKNTKFSETDSTLFVTFGFAHSKNWSKKGSFIWNSVKWTTF